MKQLISKKTYSKSFTAEPFGHWIPDEEQVNTGNIINPINCDRNNVISCSNSSESSFDKPHKDIRKIQRTKDPYQNKNVQKEYRKQQARRKGYSPQQSRDQSSEEWEEGFGENNPLPIPALSDGVTEGFFNPLKRTADPEESIQLQNMEGSTDQGLKKMKLMYEDLWGPKKVQHGATLRSYHACITWVSEIHFSSILSPYRSGQLKLSDQGIPISRTALIHPESILFPLPCPFS